MIGHIIGWIVVGAILGALARLLVPGKDPMSIPATIIMGVLGQLITIGLVLISRRTGIGRRSTV
jgi:uncharacterized membrane protein YeaQ/YmgE (transglycosylase-associated protein family)